MTWHVQLILGSNMERSRRFLPSLPQFDLHSPRVFAIMNSQETRWGPELHQYSQRKFDPQSPYPPGPELDEFLAQCKAPSLTNLEALVCMAHPAFQSLSSFTDTQLLRYVFDALVKYRESCRYKVRDAALDSMFIEPAHLPPVKDLQILLRLSSNPILYLRCLPYCP